MSKKIDDALQKLTKALAKHAKVTGETHVSIKKAERAAVKLQAAAVEYADAVYKKNGLETPFSSVVRTGLDASTIDSLTAERDAISKSLTAPVPVVKRPL